MDVRKVVRALIGCPQRARRLVPFPTIARETGHTHSSRNATAIELVATCSALH